MSSLPERFTGWLTINRNCNLRCKWCYAAESGFRGQMGMDIFHRSVSLYANLPLRNIVLIGGEPTLHPNLVEMVQFLHEKKYNVQIITNSVKFANADFLKTVVDAGLHGITTSLKASDGETYKEATGVDVFNSVMEGIHNIENIRSEKLSHKVSLILCGRMFDCFDETLNSIVKSGVRLVSFDSEKPTLLSNGETHFDGGVTPKEMADFIVKSYPKMEAMGIRFNIRISLPFCLFPSGFIAMLTERNQILSGCQILSGRGVIIDVNGSILPCNHFCGYPLGNIGDCGEGYCNWRQKRDIVKFYNTVGAYPDKRCHECGQWKYCDGGCRIHWLHQGAKELLPQQERSINE